MLNATSEPATTVPSASASRRGCSTVLNNSQLDEASPRATSSAGPSVDTCESRAFDLLRGGSTSDLVWFLDSYLRQLVTDRLARMADHPADVEIGEAWQQYVCDLWNKSARPADYESYVHLFARTFKFTYRALRYQITMRNNPWTHGKQGCYVIESINELEQTRVEAMLARTIDVEHDVTLLGPSRRILDDLMAKLSQRQREAVWLVEGCSMTPAEASELMGVEARHVSYARSKGLRRLSELARRYGLEVAA